MVPKPAKGDWDMKRKFVFVLILGLYLTGCSSNNLDSTATSETANIIATNKEEQNTQKHTSTETNTKEILNDKFSEIESNAKERAENAKPITSGDLFNKITAIQSNIVITDLGSGTLLLEITENESSIKDNVLKFYSTLSQIINTCIVGSEYNSITSSFYVNTDMVAMITVVQIRGVGDFDSSDPLAFNPSYEQELKDQYDLLFSTTDLTNKYDKSLDDLAKKYGINIENFSNNSTAGQLWAYTAFGEESVCTEVNGEIHIDINSNYDDNADSGKQAKDKLESALKLFNEFQHADPGLMPYDYIEFQFKDNDGKTLWTYITEKSDSKWDVTTNKATPSFGNGIDTKR